MRARAGSQPARVTTKGQELRRMNRCWPGDGTTRRVAYDSTYRHRDIGARHSHSMVCDALGLHAGNAGVNPRPRPQEQLRGKEAARERVTKLAHGRCA
jgi:hypothetical protein